MYHNFWLLFTVIHFAIQFRFSIIRVNVFFKCIKSIDFINFNFINAIQNQNYFPEIFMINFLIPLYVA